MGLAGERLERELAPLARRAPGLRGSRGRGCFLGDGVPFAAGVALALPTAINGSAVLTDEGELATGHGIRSLFVARIRAFFTPVFDGL
jgi:hypothetical protein